MRLLSLQHTDSIHTYYKSRPRGRFSLLTYHNLATALKKKKKRVVLLFFFFGMDKIFKMKIKNLTSISDKIN